jgi:urease accessory protein
MKRASTHIPKRDLDGRIAVDSITLERADRFKRRIAWMTDRGHEFLLDLAEATYLAHGDALQLEDGTLIKVQAAAEPLIEIHAHDAASHARIAWHIGNRHTPAEITNGAIYIQPDHVLEEMVIGLGAHVHHVKRPFEPEGGAYGGKGPLQKGHHHGHSHDHAHSAHDHEHSHDHDHGHAHKTDGRKT